jgi:uncharacterized protein YjiS (DUF1127 family)
MKTLWRYWLRLCEALVAARTRKELHGLSDHLLKDLGLRRSQIDSLGKRNEVDLGPFA